MTYPPRRVIENLDNLCLLVLRSKLSTLKHSTLLLNRKKVYHTNTTFPLIPMRFHSLAVNDRHCREHPCKYIQKAQPPASCGRSQRAGGIMEYYMFCLWGYSFHNGSSCQFFGKPIAFVIVWDLSQSKAMISSLKSLFGQMLCSRYAK